PHRWFRQYAGHDFTMSLSTRKDMRTSYQLQYFLTERKFPAIRYSNNMEFLFFLFPHHFVYLLYIPPRTKLASIVKAQHRIHQRGSQIASAPPAPDNNLRHFRESLYHVFGFLHMYE